MLYSFRDGLLCLDADNEHIRKWIGSFEEIQCLEGVTCNEIKASFSCSKQSAKIQKSFDDKSKDTLIRYWFAPYESLRNIESNKSIIEMEVYNVFINERFDENMIKMTIDESSSMFFENHIKCDQMKRILDTQNYSDDLARDFYALIFGRSIQASHTCDDQKIIAALFGIGGSGKKCILKTLWSLFQMHSVRILSDHRPFYFDAEKCSAKKLLIYDGMEPDSNIGSDLFNQMLNAKTVFFGHTIAKDIINFKKDVSQNIAVFFFTETVGVKQDESLEHKIREQLSQIIMRGFYSYFHLLNRINCDDEKNIWSVLSKELVQQQKILKQTIKSTKKNFLQNK